MIYAFFLCLSLGGAEQVAVEGSHLIPGVSPLPSDCRWLEHPTPIKSLSPVSTYYYPRSGWVTNAKVTLVTKESGFSSGSPFIS